MPRGAGGRAAIAAPFADSTARWTCGRAAVQGQGPSALRPQQQQLAGGGTGFPQASPGFWLTHKQREVQAGAHYHPSSAARAANKHALAGLPHLRDGARGHRLRVKLREQVAQAPPKRLLNRRVRVPVAVRRRLGLQQRQLGAHVLQRAARAGGRRGEGKAWFVLRTLACLG